VEAAAAHFSQALAVRSRVYADAPHRELAATLGALGRCSHRQGRLDEAAEFFRRQRVLLSALMQEGPPDVREGAAADRRASLKWARAVALEAGDAAACAELAAEMRAHRPAAPAAQPEADGARLSFRGAVQPPPPAHPARAVAVRSDGPVAGSAPPAKAAVAAVAAAAAAGEPAAVELGDSTAAGRVGGVPAVVADRGVRAICVAFVELFGAG
jgi:hypothetical protein